MRVARAEPDRPADRTVADFIGEANLLRGRLVSLEGQVVVYLGNHEQYFLRLGDGTELKAIEWKTEAPKAEAAEAWVF